MIRTVIILQSLDILYMLKAYISAQEQVVVVGAGIDAHTLLPRHANVLYREGVIDRALVDELQLTAEDRVILNCNTEKELNNTLETILSCCDRVSVLVLNNTEIKAASPEQLNNVVYLSIAEFLTEHISSCWEKIENRKKVAHLKELTRDADRMLILTQHEPDPDALASGLALRTLLGRTSVSAPIGSFGEVTRNENQTMMQLLEIHLTKITAENLEQFAKIAMVDVQPFYFGNPDIKTDIIIDHHPQREEYRVPFCDIRVHYGATSTIIAEYLFAEETKISQRLATALVYGIKTDTLFLGRDINSSDIKAFTHIYPLANRHMILQMEHPRLKPDEIHLFVKALKNQKLIGNIVFADLGRVSKEDIIPRLADFCMEIDGAQWSVISGIVEKNIVLSVRNVGYVEHAGEVARHAFGKVGSAGGHRSTAKAVMPLAAFKKHFKISRKEEIGKKIIELFLHAK